MPSNRGETYRYSSDTTVQKIVDRQRDRRSLDQFLERNRRRLAAGDRVAEPAQLLEMAFVRFSALPEDGPVARLRQLSEIVDDECLSIAEDNDVLLPHAALRAERGVDEARDRSVVVADRRSEVVAARVRQRAGIDRDRVDRSHRRSGEKPEDVVH